MTEAVGRTKTRGKWQSRGSATGLVVVVLAAALWHEAPDLLMALSRGTAWVTETVLQWCGLAVSREQTILSHPGGFAYKIAPACTGVIEIAAVAVGLSVLPGGPAARALRLLCSALLILVLNLLRLVSLFLVGVYSPAYFETMHNYVWQGAMLLALLALFTLWIKQCERPSIPLAPHVS